MCGIAGIIHRDSAGHELGPALTSMLQALKHRGPDSTGYALYRAEPDGDGHLVLRYKLADANDPRGPSFARRSERVRREVEARLAATGAAVVGSRADTEYAFRLELRSGGDARALADAVEDVPGCEVLSLGGTLEIVKDLGDAETVARQYGLGGFRGTHGIGHVRMATESDVDISGAHPYWAYPFPDVAVVHNGQLTNYWQWRRRLERAGHRFQSLCDSEVIAVYVAHELAGGRTLEEAMRASLADLDGVFTYLCVTGDSLGVAKDELAAKPLVLYEADDLVVVASEEIAIRALLPHEIETSDPYEGEVLVWTR